MLFTSEQVSCGHPDKICDQIADAVLTDCLRHDPESRVAIECLIKDNVIVLAGELTSEHMPDTNALAHEVLRRIGVPESESYESAAFITCQSRDIARGVDRYRPQFLHSPPSIRCAGGCGNQGCHQLQILWRSTCSACPRAKKKILFRCVLPEVVVGKSAGDSPKPGGTL